jgi:integrase
MNVKLRYVISRVGRRGKVRWYWERKGHPLVRLPDDLAGRVAMAQHLNNRADAVSSEQDGLARGSIAWIVHRYRQSEKFATLAPGTKRYYERYLRDIEALGPDLPFKTAFTRRAVVDFVETYEKPHQRRQAAAVLKVVFNRAEYEGFGQKETAAKLDLKAPNRRERIWGDDEVDRWIDAVVHEPDGWAEPMITAFRCLQYMAQRPGDVLDLVWQKYDAVKGAMRLKQQKTGAFLDVPIDPLLVAHLNGVRRSNRCLMIVTYQGKRVSYRAFNDHFLRIAKRAGVDAQARDLRRTAMVNMALAGANIPMIASVSGHSIEATQKILDTYLPRNFELGKAAIERLVEWRERRKARTKSNAFEKT